jgi:xylan 1,4-beta-xylosidase
MTNMSLRASPGRTYRWYTGDAVVPFGFGLHYTNFSTSFLSANKSTYEISSLLSRCTTVAYLDQCPFANIEIKLSNTGKVTSDYIALLFLYGAFGPAPYPIKTLVAYDHVHSLAGHTSQTVSLPLTLGSIARVDDEGNTVVYPGTYRLGVDIAPESFLEFTLTGSEAVLDQWPQPE